jgi:hypothetical protein
VSDAKGGHGGGTAVHRLIGGHRVKAVTALFSDSANSTHALGLHERTAFEVARTRVAHRAEVSEAFIKLRSGQQGASGPCLPTPEEDTDTVEHPADRPRG